MTGSALLPDSTIEQIATCGEHVDTLQNLQRRARWFLMTDHREELLQEFQRIFQQFDSTANDAASTPEAPGDIIDFILGVGGSRGRVRGRGSGHRGRGSSSRGQQTTTAAAGPPRRGRSAATSHS
jgi:hypothetical protein